MKKILLSCVTCLLALGLVTACDETDGPEDKGSETPDTGETIPSGDGGDSGDTSGTLPGGSEEEDDSFKGTYWLGYEYSDKFYSFSGAIDSSYYGQVKTDTNDSVSVILTEVEGGYTLSFNDAETKSVQYIGFTENNTSRNFSYSSTPTVWEYNETYETFVAPDSTGDYVFIGNYYGESATYNELRISSIGYLDGTKESSNTQYPAKLYEQEVPQGLEITGRDALRVGKTTTYGVKTEDKANHDVTWSVSPEGFVTIDEYGEVTAVAEATEVTITATSIVDETVSVSKAISVTESIETTTETADFNSLSTGKQTSGSYEVLTGTTNTTSFVSCNIVWDDGTGGGTNNTRVNSGYIQWYAGEVITFAPKDSHKLVEIIVTCTSGYAKTTSVNDDTASTIIEGNNIAIYDIVDGSQSLTIKNADTAQTRFSSITIEYV